MKKVMQQILGIEIGVAGLVYIIYKMVEEYPLDTTFLWLLCWMIFHFTIGCLIIGVGIAIFVREPKT